MFTGIIQKTAVVKSFGVTDDRTHALILENPFNDLQIGESIATNGVCLTVVEHSPTQLRFDLAPETLSITALGRLAPGKKVNLERALRASDRISGHWVQGHVDGTARVIEIEAIEGGCYRIEVELPDRSFLKYCVLKGSFCLEGISLTIHGIQDQRLQFQIVPHTWRETALSDLYRGDLVNFEVDILAKYIERLHHEHKT